MQHHTVADVRKEFVNLYKAKKFTGYCREASMTSLMGGDTVEIINATFVVDENTIFGELNHEYIERELAWYKSMSLNVNDIPGGAPAVWKAVADKDGFINSNYGHIVKSEANGRQFEHAVEELKKNPESRRAIIIYTRPTMWSEYNLNGRQDFVCTNCVQYLMRDGKLNAIVTMRSSDAILGLRNDCAWQQTILKEFVQEIGYPVGDLYWNAGSLHIYSRHFYLIDHYAKTGEISITKRRYEELYGK
jgi:thymidylate synthase